MASTKMGGAETFALNVVKDIDHERYCIDFAVNQYSDNDYIYQEIRKYECQFFILPYFRVYNYFSYVTSWKRFFQYHQYDIVYGHATNSASIYLNIAKQYGAKTISHCHSSGFRGNIIQKLAKWLFSLNINNVSDFKFSCSDLAGEHLYGRRYRDLPNYYTIPNGINTDYYHYIPGIRKQVRNDLSISESIFVCGHIGSFTPVKNHQFLVNVFAEVLKINPEAKLICCGDGPLLSDIKELCQHLGIIDHVVFTGVISKPYEYLMAMDCMIFPSIFEGFPIAVLEAQATGLPVVMNSDISREVELTPIIQRLKLAQSPKEWAKAILSNDIIDREKYCHFVSNSRYNIKNSIKELEELLDRLANLK